MKIITLHQPWASFIALGLKHYETRHWQTNYRGKLAIHAGKQQIDSDGKYALSLVCELTGGNVPRIRRNYPLGQIVAIADLTDCSLITHPNVSKLEQAVGGWEYGRFAWRLENIIALPNPIPYKGQQGLKPLPFELCDVLMKEACKVL